MVGDDDDGVRQHAPRSEDGLDVLRRHFLRGRRIASRLVGRPSQHPGSVPFEVPHVNDGIHGRTSAICLVSDSHRFVLAGFVEQGIDSRTHVLDLFAGVSHSHSRVVMLQRVRKCN